MRRAISAWARMSSGLVGSSTHATSKGRSRSIHATASSTSQRWFASIAIRTSGPTVARAMPIRRTSSSTSPPTLSLIWVNPSSTASRHSRASFSSS